MPALVICTGGGIGDVLLATPVMRAMRLHYGAVIALTSAAHREVLASNPDIAEVWTDDVPFGRQVARLRSYRFAASVTTWATLRSAALPFLAGIPRRAGQAGRLYSRLFTNRVAVRSEHGDHTTHWTEILLDYSRALGCDDVAGTPHFAVPDDARRSLAALLRARGVGERYVVLHPTRGIAGVRARWPVTRLGELARALREAQGCDVVVSGGPGERATAEAVALGGGAVSLAGATNIAEFGALAAGARAVVALDSGPMHLAAAVGAPTVGIFALQSDEPDRWAPRGPRTAVVPPVYPCPPSHRKETCPDFACLAALDVASVLATLRSLLGA